jgi:ribosomal protein L35
LTKKSTKRKRALTKDSLVHASDLKSIKAQLLASA